MFHLFKRKTFALYITDAFLQVMQLSGHVDNCKLLAVGMKELPPGIVVGGEIIKKSELAEILRLLLQQASPHAIEEKECIITLCEAQTYEYAFNFPEELSGEELKKSLELKISHTIPISFETIQYDYCVYKVDKLQIAFVVAAKRDVVAAYDTFLKQACGLMPIAMESESFSILRNWKLCFKPRQGSVLIYLKNNSLSWFLVWNGLIFDSNTLSFNSKDQLLKDLKQSITFFSDVTHFQIENIFISDLSQCPPWLSEILALLALPVQNCDQQRVHQESFNVLKGDKDWNFSQFNVVTGGALRELDQSGSVPVMNILKK